MTEIEKLISRLPDIPLRALIEDNVVTLEAERDGAYALLKEIADLPVVVPCKAVRQTIERIQKSAQAFVYKGDTL